ncbi:AMP-binding protein [Nocardia cyriacigeorgica]|uniref:AMP-binding protein n=1 Tax=Nocardia cyriacigeorgica TaxID=135487 RepID=UPI0024555650|nr:AMP-binding protein [Nocardia cyriacigeorgica]
MQPQWVPTDRDLAEARITDFARFVTERTGVPTPDYAALWQWSVQDLPGFWHALWDYFGLGEIGGAVLAEETMPGARWFPGTRLNYVDQVVRQFRTDRPAIVALADGGEEVTEVSWTELIDRTAAFARTLRSLGVRPGDRVAGYLPNIPEAVIAFLGAAAVGAVWSACGQDYTAKAALDRLGQLEPSVLVTADGYRFGGREHDKRADIEQLRAGLSSVRETIVVSRLGLDVPDTLAWSDAVAGTDADPVIETESVDFDHPLWIVFSSGTTGLPKGVMLSRGAIADGLDALAEAWSWTADDVLVHGLPLFHVHGLILGVLGALRVGSPLIHTGKPTPEAYAAAPGTLYFGVPTVWSRIAENPDAAKQLADARLLVSGSAPLPVPVFERLAELTGHAPVERYGMSETMITLSTRADGERRPGWVGLPVRGVETRLCDESGAPVPHDGESIGGLQVRGPMLFDGYLNLPEATSDCWTEDGWFRTGDVAVIDQDGFHRIVGRESVDLIKSGGFRVGAGEVETTLLGHPAVAEAAVVGLPDPDLGQRIVAYVVPRAGMTAPAESDLIDHVARELSVHKRPREVRVVDTLPRNAMGKVQKKLLG